MKVILHTLRQDDQDPDSSTDDDTDEELPQKAHGETGASDGRRASIAKHGNGLLQGVFGLQRMGSRIIGWIAGPVMVLWFLTIAALGVYQIVLNPECLRAKVYHFFVLGEFRGFRAYRAIAGIVLCVTGAEALYADMGHFGAGKTCPEVASWWFYG
eukprot:Skav208755  [mRNA]  locus=scaffold1871:161592:163663:+ [translate_table: standard]